MVIVYVRENRFTHQLLSENPEFTLSIPESNTLRKAIGICGSQHGQHIDKFQLAELDKQEATIVKAPIVANCLNHLECVIHYQQDLDENQIPKEFKSKYYHSDSSLHTVYYAKIVASYQIVEE